MIKKRFGKENISIHVIGLLRFWIGVIAGIISAFAISLAFNHFREILRFFTSLSADLLIFNPSELQFFNYFFSAFSTVLGLSITIWIWMSNLTHNRNKERLFKQLSKVNAILIFWVILGVVGRFGSILPFILYGSKDYENHLNLFEEFWLIFVLIPIVVFFQNWHTIRLVYRSGNWIVISFLVCLISVFLLNGITQVDQEKLNNAYHSRFEKEYKYIDKEISDTEIKYGIEFRPETIETLKKWYAESSVQQVKSLKTAFANKRPVSLDTVILQKIVIKIFKWGGYPEYYKDTIENWHYAFPKDILRQINLAESDKNKTEELFLLLKEQIEFVNTPEVNWEDWQNVSEVERRKSSAAKWYIPKPLILELKQVRDSLIKDRKYFNYAEELPKIKEDRL